MARQAGSRWRVEAGGASPPFRAVTEGATDMVMPALDARGALVPTAVAGYRAAAAWTPATGLGVPDVAALCALAG